MIPTLKMITDKKRGVTDVLNLRDGTRKQFTSLSDALFYTDIQRTLYCRRTIGNVAREPFPVRSLYSDEGKRKTIISKTNTKEN